MIRTLAITNNNELLLDVPITELDDREIKWYWVDFDCPKTEELKYLNSIFHFHPLSIEDCLHFLQRPKVDYYESYHFFVLHSINPHTLDADEVDIFLSSNYIVSFHHQYSPEIDLVWNRVASLESNLPKGTTDIFYNIFDQLVDHYFPIVYEIEDHLNDFDSLTGQAFNKSLMDKVFNIRADLLKLRRTIVPMRDLVYRLLSTDTLQQMKEQRHYFTDIYDHLLKLAEMLDSNREITSDIRENYISITSNRMNSIMMTLTVITTIFMPLTFIAGIYGMNFIHMPELHWKYGYYVILGLMAIVAIVMFLWFKRKGWFDR